MHDMTKPAVEPRPAPSRSALRVGMVTHSFYESDNRVMRYAEALAARGDRVDVIALRRSADLPSSETLRGVHLHRIRDRFGKSGEGRSWDYLWPLLAFLFAATRWLAAHHRDREGRALDVVHVHNIPDFMAFSALTNRWRGTRVLLDIHDLVPEFFASKFASTERSVLARSLRTMERWSAKAADHVILANHLWLDRYTARSADASKCSVFLNHVDEDIFCSECARSPVGDSPLILFPGGLQPHQGVDIAIRAFHKLLRRMPKARFHVYGDGGAKPGLCRLTRELGLEGRVVFFDPLPLRDIARVMATADLAVVPKRADSFGNEAYSTKIMEFLALGVPVVASDTRIDRYYFDESVVRFFESGNADALCEAMLEVLSSPAVRARLVAGGKAHVRQQGWSVHRERYLALVDRLAQREAHQPAALDAARG